MNIVNWIKERYFTPVQPLPVGVYHYQAPPESSFPYRLFLRLEQDGTGVMIVNACTVLHLNFTAAEYAYYLIQQIPEEEIARRVSRRYNVSRERALRDYSDLRERLETLINTPDLDPVSFLDFDRQAPYSGKISAPYRLDCALTYRQADESDSARRTAPLERVKCELTCEEWKTILNKIWRAGVPQVVFTGGEPTLRPDLVDLIKHAEQLGQVTGLLTDGLRLAESEYLHQLLQSGLDHLMIVLNPLEDQAWEGLRDTLAEDIFTTVHLTVTPENAPKILAILERIEKIFVELESVGGIKNKRSLSLSASDPSVMGVLEELRRQSAVWGFSLVWDLPVPYSQMNPVALELVEGAALPVGAGRAWLYVEPDGDVLEAQGMPKVLGNLLTDTWEKIWENVPISA